MLKGVEGLPETADFVAIVSAEGCVQVGACEMDHVVQARVGRPGRVQQGEGQARGWPE